MIRLIAGARLAIVAIVCAVAPPLAGAQQPARVTVHGVAFDSLHAAPLRGAFVVVTRTGQSTTTDSLGRFMFADLAPGQYQVAMQHDALDAIGMSSLSVRATVTDGADTIRLAVPSFATIWGALCHTPTPPGDSGIVYGTVRGVDGKTGFARATVSGTWIDVGFETTKGFSGHRWRLEIQSDASGGYALCSVPLTTGLRLYATADSSTTGIIDILPLDKERIRRADLTLGASAANGAASGIVQGTVTGDRGPIPDARVLADGAPEVRSARDGRFTLRRVPVGTQQIEVRAIGLTPVFATVDVSARDTARVAINLSKATVLDSVRVVASTVRQRLAANFVERSKSQRGYFRDSTAIAKHPILQSVFSDMPAVSARPLRGGGLDFVIEHCTATLFVDGVKLDGHDIWGLRPEDLAAVEVYRTFDETPVEYQQRSRRPPLCGTVVIWTKRYWH